MSVFPVLEPFPDNWAYLKSELNWLDRILMSAVARQRKETREVERMTQARSDRVTSHWWKGLINLDDEGAFDDFQQQKQVQREGAALRGGYLQQLEARIQLSHQRGIPLALPALQSRLQLNLFEKNLVLMSLAPEVNRRYARIYTYLQECSLTNEIRIPPEMGRSVRGKDKDPGLRESIVYRGLPRHATDLPTLDLVFRILCRNDSEWRTARHRLSSESPLLQYGLLELMGGSEETWLASRPRLTSNLVNYLLADHPDHQSLDRLLQSLPMTDWARPLTSPNPGLFQEAWTEHGPDFDHLLLPAPLHAALRQLGHHVQFHDRVEHQWAFESTGLLQQPGRLVLFCGATGTGKTLAAQAIAHSLHQPLFWVDFALVAPQDYSLLFQKILHQAPAVLLCKSARLLLGSSSSPSVPESQLYSFFHQRRRQVGLTLLSVRSRQGIKLQWQRQCDRLFQFPLPDVATRQILWQRSFPKACPLDPELDWAALARRFKLSGGQIAAIAREAAFALAAEAQETPLSWKHLQQAIAALRHAPQ